MLLASACALSAKSQTKGTNAVGFGVRITDNKSEYNVGNTSYTYENRLRYYNLSYGRFVKDSRRLGVTAYYSNENSKGSNSASIDKGNNYGGSLNYTAYYPLFGKFYAFAGGNAGYLYGNRKSNVDGSGFRTTNQSNRYNVGATGGAAYFLSKRFAFEAQLLNADIYYQKEKIIGSNSKATSSSFNISSAGAITNLGFNIYFLF